MYAPGGKGEMYEAFNFAKSGATTDFVLKTFPEQILNYGRGGEVTCIVSVGGNDSRAKQTPDNYVSTVEEYIARMDKLLQLLTARSTHVIVVGFRYVDESKTNPKTSPFDGTKSYFTNARFQVFNKALRELCNALNITFVSTATSVEEWQRECLYSDGLHPNETGHRRIFEAIKEHLDIS
jgi:lysophospholipase L1-like esterase